MNHFPLGQNLVPQIDPNVAALNQRAKDFVNAAWVRPRARPTQAPEESVRPMSRQDRPSAQMDAAGFADNVPRSLIKTESGGNWFATNNERGHGGRNGHYGILQLGHARLADAKKAGVIPSSMTPEEFIGNQDAQVAVANWHFSDIDQRIHKRGLDQYYGQTIGGVPITPDSLRAMAHLGGTAGMAKFVQTGGAYNPADSFGTSLAKYGKIHAYQ